MTRGDFRVSAGVRRLMHWFDAAKVRNVDERKRRITLRHVLTMTTGIDWNEEIRLRRSQEQREPHGSFRRLGSIRD